jgi:hypothetical protein
MINKPALIEGLNKAHNELWEAVVKLPVEKQNIAAPGKWSAAQHIQHINIGIGALAKYFTLPKEYIVENFGVPEQASRSYNELFTIYSNRIKAGAVATGKYVPEDSSIISLNDEMEKGRGIMAAMVNAINTWTEEELDTYVCPHPLLGKLTVREMLYFTIFHAQHHMQSAIRA